MTLPLVRARRKPRFGLPWLALLLGIGTLIFAFQGWQALTARPGAQLEITVEGQHPLNISQATVDAVMGEPIDTWEPLRMLVTPRLLSYDERKGLENAGADVVLSTALVDDPSGSTGDRRFNGAGVYPAARIAGDNWDLPFDIHGAYLDNVGLGHGPKAVAAAAQRAVEVLDRGPVKEPVFWLTGTVIGLAATVLALAFSHSRRTRRERILRRLTAAQRQLAGVVLELDALEATYEATPQGQRTVGFTSTWRTVRDSSLDLARTEDAAMEAVHSSRTALKPHTAELVKAFESRARLLAARADALMGAGSVLGGLAGRQGVLDRIAAPMALAGRELLARLETRPAGTVSAQRVVRFKEALDALLSLTAGNLESSAALQAWTKAEAALQGAAQTINKSLRHRHRAPLGTAKHADLMALRQGLGLSRTGSEWVLTTLDNANAAAHSLFGPLPGSGEEPLDVPPFRWYTLVRFLIFRPSAKTSWIAGCCAIVLISVVAGAVAAAQAPPKPSRDLRGSHALQSLIIDGDLPGVSESSVRKSLGDVFPQDTNVTVAVRDAVEYKVVDGYTDTGSWLNADDQDPQKMVDAMWRLKGEFPQLVDRATGELHPNQTIIAAWTLGDGPHVYTTLVTGAVALGDRPQLANSTWEYGSYHFSRYVESGITGAIEDVAGGLQGNGYLEPRVSTGWVFVLLTLSFALGLAALALAVRYGGAMSMKLGRFGRNARTLRDVRNRLNALALGLDTSRLNSVTLPGPGRTTMTVDSEQRIFESALAMAWRMAEDLAARPLSDRLNAGYVVDIEKLGRLVALLEVREGDMRRRTKLLLDAAFGRTG